MGCKTADAVQRLIGGAGKVPMIRALHHGTHGGDARPLAAVTKVARLMLPDDANPHGNVHGGTILRMIEDAGHIASSRHCASLPMSFPCATAVARISRMDFAAPMKIGQLARVEATTTFASNSSLEVHAVVTAEDLHTGKVTRTNEARLWYVRVKDSAPKGLAWGRADPAKVPPRLEVVHAVPPLEDKQGRIRYEQQKKSRSAAGLEAITQPRVMQSPLLAAMILPSDCYMNGTVFGGVIMKLIDSAGGACAASFCHSNVVTASIDAMNFESPIYLGNIARFYAHPTFTSSRSLEVAVYVEAEDLMTGNSWRAVSAHLTFVSLGEDGKSVPVRQLEPRTHQERVDFAAGKARYELRKRERPVAGGAKAQ